jgi:hypothetical protein
MLATINHLVICQADRSLSLLHVLHVVAVLFKNGTTCVAAQLVENTTVNKNGTKNGTFLTITSSLLHRRETS